MTSVSDPSWSHVAARYGHNNLLCYKPTEFSRRGVNPSNAAAPKTLRVRYEEGADTREALLSLGCAWSWSQKSLREAG